MPDVPTIHPDDEVLSLGELGRELNVPRSTTYLWALRGLFPTRRICGRYVITRSDADAFKASRAAKAGAANP